MPKSIQIPFSPPLEGTIYPASGELGLIFTHGERSDIDAPIFNELAKDLSKRGVTVLLFRMPFKSKKKRIPDPPTIQEEAFMAVWDWVHTQSDLKSKKWSFGGHDIGAKAAIRTAMIVGMSHSHIPPVVSISFPLYPPNRPEKLSTDELNAVMGAVLFCQGDRSNQGTYDRLVNQLATIANFSETKLIKGADHDMNVEGRPPHIVAKWLSNDIVSFLTKNHT